MKIDLYICWHGFLEMLELYGSIRGCVSYQERCLPSSWIRHQNLEEQYALGLVNYGSSSNNQYYLHKTSIREFEPYFFQEFFNENTVRIERFSVFQMNLSIPHQTKVKSLAGQMFCLHK